MRLGRLPTKFDARTLKLANYLSDTLPTPKIRVNWDVHLKNLGVMLNDQLGDCTIASVAHMIQVWSSMNGAQRIISDADVLKAYEGACGYNPADPSTDRGGVELDVLNYWRTVGIGGDKLFAFAAVNYLNRKRMKQAIDLFGGVYLGLALPVSAQGQEIWTVPSYGVHGQGAPGSWGGHAVPVVDFTPTGLVVITWGRLLTMTWKFLETYCEEAYALLSQDWAPGGRPAPSGFALGQLQTDLGAIVK